jgi:uncharacterized protein YbjT (DUF2867 family)
MQNTKNALVIGGSGFVGQAVCNELVKAGYRVTVPTRRYHKAKHLLPLPTCHIVEGNIHDRATLGQLVVGQDVIINLLGVHSNQRGKPYGLEFRTNHVEFPKALATSMLQHKIKRLIHVSALGVGVQNPAPSKYLRSKTDGEAHIKDSGLAWTILRPSVIFGKDDKFLNMFACLSKLFPVIPLTCSNIKFQPVFVGDVARAIAACATDPSKDTHHSTFDLVGPEVFTLKELLELSAKAIGKKPCIIGIPSGLGKIQASLMGLLPGKPLITIDNINSMSIDNIHTAGKLFPLEHYECLSVIAPSYLREAHCPSELDVFRAQVHR